MPAPRLLAVTLTAALLGAAAPAPPPTSAEVLAASTPAEWRRIDPENTLYLELPAGRVIIELAPDFAPRHVANIKALVRAGYFDGAAIIRSHDNYVVQWGQPDEARPLGPAVKTLPAEFERAAAGLAFDALPDRDTYAPEAGFSRGLPAGRDAKAGKAWMLHCYGTVGVGRDEPADSGGGTELYAVTGQSPRHLDRNITVVGRVLQGMELLSVMPRGTGDLGFYKTPEERTPIARVRVAADLPAAERTELEALRTDSASFKAYVEARRNRREAWFKRPAGAINVCNVPLPLRTPG
jgi:peptidylprolyl isomerase